MTTRERKSETPRCADRTLAWVKAAYLNSLKRYGPNHPLTRSWLAEIKDVENFLAHLPH